MLRLAGCDLKSISYLSSQLPLLSDHKWDADKQLKAVSNIRQQEASSHMEQILGSVSFQIPHSSEVEAQFLEAIDEDSYEGTLFKARPDKLHPARIGRIHLPRG